MKSFKLQENELSETETYIRYSTCPYIVHSHQSLNSLGNEAYSHLLGAAFMGCTQ